MSKESTPGYEFEIDPQAGKYEKFEVTCKTCEKISTINVPVSSFKNEKEKEEYGKQAAEDFKCDECYQEEIDPGHWEKVRRQLEESEKRVKENN